MQFSRLIPVLLFVLSVFVSVHQLHAQKESQQPSVVSVSGEASSSVAPSRMRLIFSTQSSASDAKSAMQALQKQQKTIEEELGKYNSKPLSIQFKRPQMVSIVQGIRQLQNDNPFGESPILLGPETQMEEDEETTMLYTASCNVQAEWNLKSTDQMTLFLDSLELKKYLKERNLVESVSLEPDPISHFPMVQDDFLFIAPGASSYTSVGGWLDPCKITYVGDWTKDQENSSIKAAFEDAKSKAKLLAESANKKIKGVYRLQRSSIKLPDDIVQRYSNGMYGYAQVSGGGFDFTHDINSTNEREVESLQPDGLSKSIQLDVEFEIE